MTLLLKNDEPMDWNEASRQIAIPTLCVRSDKISRSYFIPRTGFATDANVFPGFQASPCINICIFSTGQLDRVMSFNK
jgi:hypothetical protein